MYKRLLDLSILTFLLIVPFSFSLSTSSTNYEANILVGGSGGHSTSSTYNLDLLLGQGIVGSTNSSSYSGYLGFFYGSYLGENVPYPPNKVILTSPTDNSSGTDRTPTFTWEAAYDRNGDTLTYQFLLSKDKTFTTPSDLLYNISSISSLSYAIPSNLDVDTSYFWKVRANDSTGYGEFSDVWNHTVSSLQAIEIVNNSVDFTNLQPGNTDDTSDDSPNPFVLRNTGNIPLNITINTSNSPFDMQPLNTKYFEAKAGDYESGSINLATSVTSWINLTNQTTSFIKELQWDDSNDEARIDIKVEVPESEPVGEKKSNITFEVE